MKLNQYMVEGLTLYRKNCSNCHQNDGSGFKRLYPPLKESDYLINSTPIEWVCLIHKGRSEGIVVNGNEYTQPMPGVETLTALEIAEIITYVENTWGKGRGIVEVKEVQRKLDECQ